MREPAIVVAQIVFSSQFYYVNDIINDSPYYLMINQINLFT